MTTRDVIARRMEALGWSQSDLSRATGIPRQNLSPILRGDRPLRANHLFVLDQVLNLGLDYGACRWDSASKSGG